MLKALLYIFAVVGLLISPAYAQAAQKDCAGMSSSTTMSMAHTSAEGMDCCDHSTKDMSKKDKACFENCIAMCGVTVTAGTETGLVLPVLAIEQVVFNDKAPVFFTQEPGLFIPPPKSIA